MAGLAVIAAAIAIPTNKPISAAAWDNNTVTSPAHPFLRRAALQDPSPTPEHGGEIYSRRCAFCHNTDRSGKPGLGPSLVDVTKKVSDEDLIKLLRSGKGRMPAFTTLPDTDLQSILLFLKTSPDADPANPGA